MENTSANTRENSGRINTINRVATTLRKRRLRDQRDLAYRMLNEIPGVSVNQAKGALYLFPKLDPEVYPIKSDEKFALDLLEQQKILISHGTAFNWIKPDHFRLVTLPNLIDLEEAIGRIAEFLSTYKP